MRSGWLAAAVVVAGGLLPLALARPARAQLLLEEAQEEDNAPIRRYHSPQHFAFQFTLGPYRPDVDSEFGSSRQPYRDYFGPDRHLMGQIQLDYQFWRKMGTAAIGLGAGYFSVSGPAPNADHSGTLSGDKSALTVVPVSLSLVYRFDHYLETQNFPLVPHAKLGLDYAYWKITDGNGEIANDSLGNQARGGTLGWHAAIGVALVLDMFDPDAARSFDNEMGVNHSALVFEYGHYDISGLGETNRLHVGDTTWTLGLMFEF